MTRPASMSATVSVTGELMATPSRRNAPALAGLSVIAAKLFGGESLLSLKPKSTRASL